MLNILVLQKICYSMENRMHEQDSELFNDLPTEVILENLLPNLDLLELCTLRSGSKAWNYRICLYFSRTKKLDLSEFKDTINETGFRSIVQHLSKLQEIILDGCWRTASKSNLLNLLKNCRSLKYFSSKRCKFVDDEVYPVCLKTAGCWRPSILVVAIRQEFDQSVFRGLKWHIFTYSLPGLQAQVL